MSSKLYIFCRWLCQSPDIQCVSTKFNIFYAENNIFPYFWLKLIFFYLFTQLNFTLHIHWIRKIYGVNHKIRWLTEMYLTQMYLIKTFFIVTGVLSPLRLDLTVATVPHGHVHCWIFAVWIIMFFSLFFSYVQCPFRRRVFYKTFL